jgi:replicative DNA helicase
MVIFPYRPEYYGILEDDKGESLEGVMMLIIAKNRNGKRTGDVFAKYSPDLTQFFDYDYFNESETETREVNF